MEWLDDGKDLNERFYSLHQLLDTILLRQITRSDGCDALVDGTGFSQEFTGSRYKILSEFHWN